MTRYVALLRGINVGGNNVIPMRDLRDCFETLGLDEVSTYIQSGNVLFTSDLVPTELVPTIEAALADRFTYSARTALLSAADLTEVIDRAPQHFGDEPDRYRYDVMYVLPTGSVDDVISQLSPHPEVDTAWPGRGAVYFRRLSQRATASRLSRFVQAPAYRHITARNWNTTVALAKRL